MIILKSLIREGRGEQIDINTAISLLDRGGISIELLKNIKKNNKLLYRGKKSSSHIEVVDPKSEERYTSKDSFSYYNLILNNLNNWDIFPKRNNSLICSNNIEATEHYGNPFIVIPLSMNASIAMCETSDIWFSIKTLWKYNIYDLNKFNQVLENIFRITKEICENKYEWSHVKLLIKSYSNDNSLTFLDLKILFDIIDQSKIDIQKHLNYNKNTYYNDLGVDFFNDYINSNLDFYDFIEKIFNPVANNIHEFNYYKSYNEIISPTYQDAELWTDSISLMLDTETFKNLLRKSYND